MGQKLPLNHVDIDLSIVELPDERYDRENREREIVEEDDRAFRDWAGIRWYEGWDE